MKAIFAIAACLIGTPAQAEIFSCRNDKIHVQFKIEDGEWYQRASPRYSWHDMRCGNDGIECDYGRSVHSWQKTVSATAYSWEFIYVNSGRWVSESNFGSGHRKLEGTCEIVEDDDA